MVPLCRAQFAFVRNALNQFVVLTSDSVANFTARSTKHRKHHVSSAPSRLPIEERLTNLEAFTHRLSLRHAGDAWVSFFRFLLAFMLAHRDAFIVLCKFKQPFLRLVEAHTFCLRSRLSCEFEPVIRVIIMFKHLGQPCRGPVGQANGSGCRNMRSDQVMLLSKATKQEFNSEDNENASNDVSGKAYRVGVHIVRKMFKSGKLCFCEEVFKKSGDAIQKGPYEK